MKIRNAVEEDTEVEALLALPAETELAEDREDVRAVEPARLLVEAARRSEVGEPEMDARVLEALAEDGERTRAPDLRGDALEELGPRGLAVLGFVAIPFLGLCGEDEVVELIRNEAELAVVVPGRRLW